MDGAARAELASVEYVAIDVEPPAGRVVGDVRHRAC